MCNRLFSPSDKPYCFMIYDRTSDSIIEYLNTPTESINLNSMIKSPLFSVDHPYLIYKDSRKICIINAVTYEIEEVKAVPYKFCGKS